MSRYLADLPTDRDALGFNDSRPPLTEILLRGETPLIVGIFGRWGTGKTSLLRMLRKDVKRERGQLAKGEVRTVWFTAWKYQRSVACLHSARSGCALPPQRAPR